MTARQLTTSLLTAPTLTWLLMGCSEPDWTRVIGNLNHGPDRTISLTLPGQVAVGEAFPVTIQSFGSTGCIRADGIEATVMGNRARLVPYDEVPLDGAGCLRDLRPFDHATTLTFQEPGSATLRVIGYFGVPDTAVLDSADFTIQVKVP